MIKIKYVNQLEAIKRIDKEYKMVYFKNDSNTDVPLNVCRQGVGVITVRMKKRGARWVRLLFGAPRCGSGVPRLHGGLPALVWFPIRPQAFTSEC